MNQNQYWDNVDDAEEEAKIAGDQLVCESFTDKSYVPRQSYKKYIKPWHLALSAIAIILLIIIVTVSLAKKGDIASKGENAVILLSEELIICGNNSLWKYNLKDQSTKIIKTIGKTIGSYDLYNDVIFWNEPNASKIFSESNLNRMNSTKKNPDVVFEELRFKVQAIAMDYYTRKLYAIDKTTGTAIVIDLQSKQYGILLSDLKQPEDIQLDVKNGLMFILQPAESILSSYMDGASLQEIIRSPYYISAITLDYKHEMIYGIEDYNTIIRTDYKGQNRVSIIKDYVNIISLTISNDHLFWLWASHELHNSTLWSCQIKNDTCHNHRIEFDQIPNATSVKSLSHRSDVNLVSNPCTLYKNICQHLCLLSAKIHAGRRCGCFVGWELRSDPRSCQPIERFLVYVMGTTVRGRTLNFNRESFTEVFLPVNLSIESLTRKGSVDFDYDAHNDIFYVSDDVHIYNTSLRRVSNQTILLTTPNTHYIEDLALDSLSQNLYYSNCSKTKNFSHYMNIFTVRENHSFNGVLLNFDYKNNFGLNACPYATIIDPVKGNLFFSAGDNSHRSIYRIGLNGTRLKMLNTRTIDFIHRYRLLAIDYELNRLYRLSRSGLEAKLSHVNFDGSDESILHIRDVPFAKNIYVYDQWLFITTEMSIWRGNKTTGENFQRIVPRIGSDLNEPISALKIIDMHLNKDDKNHPCLKDNGGCAQFCYTSPNKTCGCINNRKLQDDGTCS